MPSTTGVRDLTTAWALTAWALSEPSAPQLGRNGAAPGLPATPALTPSPSPAQTQRPPPPQPAARSPAKSQRPTAAALAQPTAGLAAGLRSCGSPARASPRPAANGACGAASRGRAPIDREVRSAIKARREAVSGELASPSPPPQPRRSGALLGEVVPEIEIVPEIEPASPRRPGRTLTPPPDPNA